MKKRLLSALLALALVFVLLPTTALAETPALEESDVSVASTKLFKNTYYLIESDNKTLTTNDASATNYNIYLDATGSNYVLYVKNATINAPYKGIDGTSNIVFEGTNSITAGTYGIYSDFTQSDLKISGSGTLTINTTDGYPAIATQNMSIAIGGSLDVNATTIVTIATTDKNGIAVDSAKNLTISGAAKLSATSSYVNSSAIRVGNASKNTTGNLTVNSGATLIATSTSTKPTVQVGGNASFTGSTVAITNNSTTQGEQYKDSYEVSSALHVDGTIDISGGKVTATATAGGNAIRAVGDITVSNGAQVTATNNAEHFSAITAGAVGSNKEINTLYNLIVSGENTKITATNTNTATDLVYRAIHAHVYNNNTDFYLNMQSEGVKEELRNKNIAPGEYNYTGGHRVTITRGDAYTAPTTISKIIITGLTTPVKGETPVTTGVSLGTGLTVESITWGPALTSDGKFKAGTSYTAHIKYTVDEGYVLANKVDLSADGSESIVPKKDSNEIEVTFPLTAADTTHQHTSETGWQTDGTNHWKTCSTCSQNYDKGICTISGYNNDNGASGYHKVLCSVGHVMKTELHDYEYKITQNGTMHYKECKICHYTTLPVSHNFGSSGTETCECGAIPSHTHNLSGQRGHDDTNHWDICSECSQHVNEALHTYGDWITDTSATDTTEGSKHRTCSVCQYQENATIPKTGTGEIEPPTPDNPGTIVIIRPAEEEKPAQQPNPSTGANDLVGLAVAAAVAAALGSAALLRKHD